MYGGMCFAVFVYRAEDCGWCYGWWSRAPTGKEFEEKDGGPLAPGGRLRVPDDPLSGSGAWDGRWG